MGGQQDRSEGANQRAADRTNEAVDCRLQRPTDAVLGNDDGRQHDPVALGQTEGSGHRIGERGRNHHAQDEPQAGVVVGERGEGQYRHSGDRLRADSTALSASRKIRTTRAASRRLFYTLETHSSSIGEVL